MQTESLLQEWYWKNRVLLLFAPRRESIPYQQQVAALDGNRAGLAERDVIVLEAVGDRAIPFGGGLGETLETARLRDSFNIAPDEFQVVLIGEDGTEKLRSAEPIATDRLFQIMDAMPTRQRETQGERKE
ncbi:DUF4174 domain-containing protein [Rhodospirillaceae bacterium SYSU D60014]|uniref:DUF4174 domain-containing protein n=1 Tax=Virgifigura deserti TaxID=2268457 RepID=UPI000E661E42